MKLHFLCGYEEVTSVTLCGVILLWSQDETQHFLLCLVGLGADRQPVVFTSSVDVAVVGQRSDITHLWRR
ncbi:hypothetical protein D3C78_1799940 [compost metagenome]